MSSSQSFRTRPISIEDYLTGESSSRIRHEYVGGRIYAMAGGRYAHNLISANILGEFHAQLKGKPCRALNSDSRVKIQTGSQTRFYYPDVSVICGENLRDGLFQDRPTVIVEVMSQATRRVDAGEKCDAYMTIESLQYYLLLEQDSVGISFWQRAANGFEVHNYCSLSDVIELPAIGCHLALADTYAEVTFSPEIVAEE